jgi:ELWxxDGT repeat protein
VRHTAWMGVILLAPLAAFAGAPHLVRDINPTIIAVDATPNDLIDQGAWTFVTAESGAGPASREPWATDGTFEGTVRLGAVNLLPPGVTGYQTVRVGNLTYFFTNALWVSDGTAAGTHLAFNTLGIGENPSLVGELNGKLIFSLFEKDLGRELWRTDGTVAGTARVANVNGASHGVLSYVFANGKLYFMAGTADQSFEPWVTDGTEAGTHRIAQIPGAQPELISTPRPKQAGHFLFFYATTDVTGRELWRLDLNNDTIAQVADIAPGTASGLDYAVFGSVGNVALFTASSTGSTETALWRSDGTAGGTYLVENVKPIDGPEIYWGPTANGRVLFRGQDAINGAQIWSTDGSTAVRLTSAPGVILLANVGGVIYFVVNPGTVPELWRTDGTPAGTRPLTGLPAENFQAFDVAGGGSDLYVRARAGLSTKVYKYDVARDVATLLRSYELREIGTAYPSVFGYARGQLYFDSYHPVTGRELWVSNGTAAGTHLLRNMAPETRTQPSAPQHFFAFGGQLYFTADDGVYGRELWRSDGTDGGTQLVADVNPGVASSDPLTPFILGTKLYFFAKNGSDANSYKLWTTDGTSTSTSLVTALIPRAALFGGQTPCGPSVATLGSHAFFTAYDQRYGTEVYRTDGTPSGTVRVPATGGASNSNFDPCWFMQSRGRVYFSADVFGTTGRELWSVTESGESPTLLADLAEGGLSSTPMEVQTFRNSTYFLASDGTHPPQLFQTDGTSAGTRLLTSFSGGLFSTVQFGDKLVFLSNNDMAPRTSLWATDGTTAGMTPIGQVLAYSLLYRSGGHIFFQGRAEPGISAQLWVTDGTEAGTHLLLDMPETSTGSLMSFWDFNGVILFRSTDRRTGTAKLWRSDGSIPGTKVIPDLDIGPRQDYPITQLAAGQTFFYVSDNGSTGAELFAFSNDAPIAANDASGSVEAGKSISITVLTNDSDPDGQLDVASVTLLSTPAGGTVSISNTGVLTYSARSGFTGPDAFTYTVADTQGARSQPATVQLTVTAPASTMPPPSGGGAGRSGGGGALGILELLGLVGFALRRRLRTLAIAKHAPAVSAVTLS